MEVLALLVMGMANIACFVIGAKVGQTVQQGKEIELRPVRPTDNKKDLEQERMETIMHNIENYDGTPYGQKEVK